MFHKNTPRLRQVTKSVLWQSKAVTESIKSIKFLEKYNYATKHSLCTEHQNQSWELSGLKFREAVQHFTCQPGTGTLGFYLGTLFISTKKEQHVQNSGTISTSQYCSSFQDRVLLCKMF